MKVLEVKSQPLVYEALTEEPATGVHELKRHLLCSNVFGGKGHGEGQGIGRDKRKTVI